MRVLLGLRDGQTRGDSDGDIKEDDHGPARVYWNLHFKAVIANVVQGLDLRLMLAQKERRLTQVHTSRLKGKSNAARLFQFGLAFGTRRMLSTAVFTVLPCVVRKGDLAGLAPDYRWIRSEGRLDMSCHAFWCLRQKKLIREPGKRLISAIST